MQEPDNNPEEFVEKVIKGSLSTADSDDEERIPRTIARVQRNTNVRDVILLVFVRFWMVLAEITCKVFANSSKKSTLKKP